MAFEGIGFSDRASSPMGDTQTAVKVSSTTVALVIMIIMRLVGAFQVLAARPQPQRLRRWTALAFGLGLSPPPLRSQPLLPPCILLQLTRLLLLLPSHLPA